MRDACSTHSPLEPVDVRACNEFLAEPDAAATGRGSSRWGTPPTSFMQYACSTARGPNMGLARSYRQGNSHVGHSPARFMP